MNSNAWRDKTLRPEERAQALLSELSLEEKDTLSHRGLALKELVAKLGKMFKE